MNQPLRKQWIDYQEKVLPAEAHVTQVRECRRAFYAGAAAMASLLDEIAGLAERHGSLPDLEETMLKQLQADLEEFREGVGTRY